MSTNYLSLRLTKDEMKNARRLGPQELTRRIETWIQGEDIPKQVTSQYKAEFIQVKVNSDTYYKLKRLADSKALPMSSIIRAALFSSI